MACSQLPLPLSLLFSLGLLLLLTAPPAAGSCDNYMFYLPQLKPCQTYVQPGNSTMPGPECCEPLAQMTDRAGSCFCNFIHLYGKLNNNNSTRISEIMVLCNIDIPAQAASCFVTNSTGGVLPPINGHSTTSAVFPVAYGPASISPPPSNDAWHMRPSFVVTFIFFLASSLYLHAT